MPRFTVTAGLVVSAPGFWPPGGGCWPPPGGPGSETGGTHVADVVSVTRRTSPAMAT